jgi:hypothetical protein
MDFGVDESFGSCVDGLILVDLWRMTRAKRERYLVSRRPEASRERAEAHAAAASR